MTVETHVPERDSNMAESLPPARRALVDAVLDPGAAFAMTADELAPLRLQAAQELFAERIEQIPLLRKRAEDAGITQIESLADLVPLLFAHTSYKSYPQALFDKGRWDAMIKWMQTLSAVDLSDVDIADVADVDDFVERLWAAGNAVLTTSGSSGKVSFLNHTMQDRALKTRHYKYVQGWPKIKPDSPRPVFWFGPMVGRNSAVEFILSVEENWGTPGETLALDARPLLITEVSKGASFRKRMADGVATPDEIESYQRDQADTAIAAEQELKALIDQLLDRRDEPLFIWGLWAQQLMVRARAHERGIPDGDFHPETIVAAGGGIKGLNMPDNYRDLVKAFYGDITQLGIYGMTEMASQLPLCPANRYHVPPGLILLMLDQTGERLLGKEDEVDGMLTGRVGFLDLIYEGRWGGLITGDKATLDMAPHCACGAAGPTLTDSIARFSQLGEDDHIGCAGTIDNYVRSVVAA
jgi:hypothetical protein